MKSDSHRNRDYAFGEAILALRQKIGLTQVVLAQVLGISRRALGAWEAGSSYPKIDQLKKLVALAIEQHAFPSGHEADGVQALWQASHQRVPLDETWLHELLTPGQEQTTRSASAKREKYPSVLPFQPTTFVDRVTEVAEINARLGDPACRLLTLVGPGGIGKTRLAIRVAADCAEQFDDGVYFVPLQPLASPEFMVSSIADVLSFRFSPGVDLKQQLLQYLREKTLLLLLDNFEHLLDGAELLPKILDAAPNTKLLVTSREALSLQEEWRYPVRGLPYPETDGVEPHGVYSAVQLFVERARHVRADLVLANEQNGVVRICQLVEGMPLALELAAVWARAMPLDKIASEIQRNLDFLSSSLRDIPQRHQRITAIFEQTWERLSDEEQRVFSALSVFSRGFRREAAEAVAGVSTDVLSDLVDKSLLTCEPDGRYQIHELLRQYAQARLETMPEEMSRIRALHSAYYARFLQERNADLNGGRQREAALEIEADIDNVRAAWLWAVEHARMEAIDQAAHALVMFCQIQSRFVEAIDAFEKAVQVLDNGDPHTQITMAKALCCLGTMYVRAGAPEPAKVALERSWQLYSQHAVLPALGEGFDPRVVLGYVYLFLGSNIAGVEQLVREALQDHLLREDRVNLAVAYLVLAMIERVQGQYEEARQYAQQAYANTMIIGDEYRGSYCLHEWAALSQLLGDTADARRRLHASYAIQKDFGDPKGMADILADLGQIALLEGDNAEARRSYEQARSMYYELGDTVGLAAALEGMGNSARAAGLHGEAQRYLREALQGIHDRMLQRVPSIYVGIGELFLQTGKQARGVELLALALRHPASDRDTKVRAQRVLSLYEATTEAVQQTSSEVDFNVVTTTLLDELKLLHFSDTRQDERE